MHAAQKPKSKLKFVTLDKESEMSTLWRQKEFLRICSKEELAEKAQDIEVTTPVKKSQETRYNLDPEFSFVNRFGGGACYIFRVTCRLSFCNRCRIDSLCLETAGLRSTTSSQPESVGI